MKRLGVLALGVLALGGCIPAAPPSHPAPVVEQTLATPTTPLTYAWVMFDAGQPWGVQVGLKSDGSGYHVATWAWVNCAPLPAFWPCQWSDFHEFQAVDPGSRHDLAIWWEPGVGFHLDVDGATVAIYNLGDPSSGHSDVSYGEATPS